MGGQLSTLNFNAYSCFHYLQFFPLVSSQFIHQLLKVFVAFGRLIIPHFYLLLLPFYVYKQLHLILFLPTLFLHDLVQSLQVMTLLVQFHYLAIEIQSRGCCTNIFRCKCLLYNGLEISPIIIKVKSIKFLHYDVTKGFYTEGFLFTEGFDALHNLHAKGFSTLCTQLLRVLNSLFFQFLRDLSTLSIQTSGGLNTLSL